MPEVLEIEQVETEQIEQNRELPTTQKDTWILKLPAETCRREGFAEGTMVSLTVKNAGIQTEIIHRSAKSKESAKRFIEKYADFMKEIERVGD